MFIRGSDLGRRIFHFFPPLFFRNTPEPLMLILTMSMLTISEASVPQQDPRAPKEVFDAIIEYQTVNIVSWVHPPD